MLIFFSYSKYYQFQSLFWVIIGAWFSNLSFRECDNEAQMVLSYSDALILFSVSVFSMFFYNMQASLKSSQKDRKLFLAVLQRLSLQPSSLGLFFIQRSKTYVLIFSSGRRRDSKAQASKTPNSNMTLIQNLKSKYQLDMMQIVRHPKRRKEKDSQSRAMMFILRWWLWKSSSLQQQEMFALSSQYCSSIQIQAAMVMKGTKEVRKRVQMIIVIIDAYSCSMQCVGLSHILLAASCVRSWFLLFKKSQYLFRVFMLLGQMYLAIWVMTMYKSIVATSISMNPLDYQSKGVLIVLRMTSGLARIVQTLNSTNLVISPLM